MRKEDFSLILKKSKTIPVWESDDFICQRERRQREKSRAKAKRGGGGVCVWKKSEEAAET